MFRNFIKDDKAATAIEFSLIAAAMGVALVITMPLLASHTTVQFSNLGSHIATGK